MGDSYNLVVDRLNAFAVADFEGHEVERLELLSSARRLVGRLETRQERIFNIDFRNPAEYAALKICLDLGIWHRWTAVGGGEKTVEELAKLATKDCDLNLLRKCLIYAFAVFLVED